MIVLKTRIPSDNLFSIRELKQNSIECAVMTHPGCVKAGFPNWTVSNTKAELLPWITSFQE
jgi:hypothetical protein